MSLYSLLWRVIINAQHRGQNYQMNSCLRERHNWAKNAKLVSPKFILTCSKLADGIVVQLYWIIAFRVVTHLRGDDDNSSICRWREFCGFYGAWGFRLKWRPEGVFAFYVSIDLIKSSYFSSKCPKLAFISIHLTTASNLYWFINESTCSNNFLEI